MNAHRRGLIAVVALLRIAATGLARRGCGSTATPQRRRATVGDATRDEGRSPELITQARPR